VPTVSATSPCSRWLCVTGDNRPLPVQPGAPAQLVVSHASPIGIADLAANALTSGNDASGRTRIQITWTPPVAGRVEALSCAVRQLPRLRQRWRHRARPVHRARRRVDCGLDRRDLRSARCPAHAWLLALTWRSSWTPASIVPSSPT
jgi:hypothetical protein